MSNVYLENAFALKVVKSFLVFF